MSQALTPSQIAQHLPELPEWEIRDNALYKRFTFNNFPEALSFMIKVGIEAEKQSHHPTFTNTYNRVEVLLTTHDAGNQITNNDIKLARTIEAIA